MTEYVGNLSQGQYGTLVIVMATSAVLSVLGSVAVTRIAYLKMTSTYQRFLFMLSVADILNSMFLVLHQLVVPKSPDFFWAVGNTGSCTMAGFFLIFGSLSVTMYSCYLSVYFYFSIQSSPKRHKEPEDVVGIWEWFAHVSCFLVPASIAGAAAGTNNIDLSDGLGLCVITSYECESSPGDPNCVSFLGDEMKLPEDTKALGLAFIVFLAVVSFIGIAATISVYWRVRSTLLRGARSSFEGTLSDEMKQRLRAVAAQAILYTAAFVNSFLWPVLVALISSDEGHPMFVLHLLAFLFYPLQGVLNCLIYIRPRYQMLKSMYPDDSMLVVFRVSMSKAGDPEEIEEVRERIYGDAYEMPSIASSEDSIASDIPPLVEFDPTKPISQASLVSVPNDDDDMDPEVPPTPPTEDSEDGKAH